TGMVSMCVIFIRYSQDTVFRENVAEVRSIHQIRAGKILALNLAGSQLDGLLHHLPRHHDNAIAVTENKIPRLHQHFAALYRNVVRGDGAPSHGVHRLDAGSKNRKSQFLNLADVPHQSIDYGPARSSRL